jgi:hypothetical protein
MKHQLIISTMLILLFAKLSFGQLNPVDAISTVKTAVETAKQIDELMGEDTSKTGDWDDAYHTSDEDGERSSQYPFDVNHPPENAQRIGCICMDGTSMDLKGGGACAGYGGVRHWIYEHENGDKVEYPTERHYQHPEPLSEEELANLSAHSKRQTYGNSYKKGYNLGWEELMAIIMVCVTIAFVTKTIWNNRTQREE